MGASEYRLVVEHGHPDVRCIYELIDALRVLHVRRVERVKGVQPGAVLAVVRVLGIQVRPQVEKHTSRDCILGTCLFEDDVGRVTSRRLRDEQCVVGRACVVEVAILPLNSHPGVHFLPGLRDGRELGVVFGSDQAAQVRCLGSYRDAGPVGVTGPAAAAAA